MNRILVFIIGLLLGAITASVIISTTKDKEKTPTQIVSLPDDGTDNAFNPITQEIKEEADRIIQVMREEADNVVQKIKQENIGGTQKLSNNSVNSTSKVSVQKEIQEPVKTTNSTVRKVRGMSLFDSATDVFPKSSFKVYKVIDDGIAIAWSRVDRDMDLYLDPMVLLYDPQGRHFYNDQIVNVPTGKKPMIVGSYKDSYKTYPIVSFR